MGKMRYFADSGGGLVRHCASGPPSGTYLFFVLVLKHNKLPTNGYQVCYDILNSEGVMTVLKLPKMSISPIGRFFMNFVQILGYPMTE